jgi:hypothetical protein
MILIVVSTGCSGRRASEYVDPPVKERTFEERIWSPLPRNDPAYREGFRVVDVETDETVFEWTGPNYSEDWGDEFAVYYDRPVRFANNLHGHLERWDIGIYRYEQTVDGKTVKKRFGRIARRPESDPMRYINLRTGGIDPKGMNGLLDN